MVRPLTFADTVRDLMHRHSTTPWCEEWVARQAQQLGALPLGQDLWAHWFLRPNGEVVITDGEVTVVYSDRVTVFQALIGGLKHYPELAGLLPRGEPGVREGPGPGPASFVSRTVLCPQCCGTGWLPAESGSQEAV